MFKSAALLFYRSLSLFLFSPLLATFNQFAISDCLPAIYSQLFALISPWQMFSLHVAQKLDADSAVVSFGPCRFLLIMHRHRRLDQGLSYSLTTTVQLILYRIRHKWYMNGAPIDHLYAYEMSLFACHMYLQSNDSLLLLCSHACWIFHFIHDQHFTTSSMAASIFLKLSFLLVWLSFIFGLAKP